MRRKLAFGRLANHQGGRRGPRLPYPSRETPEGSTPQRVCAGTDSGVSPLSARNPRPDSAVTVEETEAQRG